MTSYACVNIIYEKLQESCVHMYRYMSKIYENIFHHIKAPYFKSNLQPKHKTVKKQAIYE